jgi:hypothetical protein
VHQSVDLGEILQVGDDRGGAELLGKRFEHVDTAAAQHELGALLRQTTGDGLAEPSGGPGDEGTGSPQVDACGHGHSPLLLLKRAEMPW